MKRTRSMKRNILIWSIAAFALAGCSDDSVMAVNDPGFEDDTPGDAPGKDPGELGGNEPGEDPGELGGDVTCQNTCERDAHACGDLGVMTCIEDEDGCLGWTISEACDEGMHCDASAFQCVTGCAEVCEAGHEKRCGAEGVEVCVSDSAGCAQWQLGEECPEGCDATMLACQAETCTSVCAVGDVQCVGEEVQACVDQAGCGAWGSVSACPADQYCDAAQNKCIGSGCQSNCPKIGDTKTTATTLQTCTDKGHGCLQWTTTTTCPNGQIMHADTKTCGLACGDDCEPFSIVFLPDSQEYARNVDSSGKRTGSPDIFNKQLTWIKDNRTKYNIKAVMHMGDMTDTNDKNAWAYNNNTYKILDNINLPYLPGTGNHDYLKCASNASAVKDCRYSRGNTNIQSAGKFDAARFSGKSWFKEVKYTGNYAIEITAANTKFLLISLEFAPRKDVLCWAENLIKKNPNHKVILSTHAYLSGDAYASNPTNGKFTSGYGGGVGGTKGMASGASGKEIMTELVARHNNIILMASGHSNASTFRINKGYNSSHAFSEMIVDYQIENPLLGSCTHSHQNGGSGGGWLRILTFDPKNNTITAKTETPMAASWFSGDKKRFWCTQYVSSLTELPSGGHISATNPKAKTHTFVADYDFTTPVTYKYTDGNSRSFTVRTINAVADKNQETPAVAVKYDSGDFVAVWTDYASGNADIHARVFCSTGCNKVSQFTVNKTTTGDQKSPDVAMDQDGNFVVVWADASDNKIYMRKFSLEGKELLTQTAVSTSGSASSPAIAMASDGTYVVTWTAGNDIYMRAFKADGSPKFGQKKVHDSALQTNGKRLLPDVGMAADGSYAIAWQDDTDGNGSFEIWAKMFHADGRDKKARFTVNRDSANQQKNPALAMSANGKFYVAWEDDTDGNETYRIRTRGFNADGSNLTSTDVFVSAAGEGASQPAVCMNDKNNVYFAWSAKSHKNSNDGNLVVRASISSAKSETMNAESIVPVRTAGIQDQPAVGCGKYGTVYLWHDDFDKNGSYEIFGRGY